MPQTVSLQRGEGRGWGWARMAPGSDPDSAFGGRGQQPSEPRAARPPMGPCVMVWCMAAGPSVFFRVIRGSVQVWVFRSTEV